MRLDWKAVVGIAISIVLLWWVFRGEDLGAIWHEIRTANVWLLAASAGVATAGFLVRALRWEVLLRPIRPGTSLDARFGATSIGFMANNVLPARIGEFARAYALSRMERITVSGAFGTLVVERFLDAVVILAYLFLALVLPGFPRGATIGGQPIGSAVEGLVVLLGVLLAGILVLLIWPHTVVRIAERIARLLPARAARLVIDVLEAFLDGLASLQNPRLVVLAFAWSFGFWAFHSISFWLAFLAFDIDVGYVAALFVNSTIALAVAVPSAPGFFGTFEAGAKIGLVEVYGVPEPQTLAFAVGYHITSFIPITIIGLWYAWRVGFSLRDVGQSEQRVGEAVEAAHPEAVEGLVESPESGASTPTAGTGGPE